MKPREPTEPPPHPSIKKGFLFVPTAAQRLAPEVLVQELFREVFFEHHYGDEGAENRFKDRPLSIDTIRERAPKATVDNEVAVLLALRGRKKQVGKRKSQDYFAPAYPSLARHAWLRKSSDRVIRDFLIAGPLAQYYRGWKGTKKEVEQRRDCQDIVQALIGHRTATPDSVSTRDILSVPIRLVDCPFDQNNCVEKLGGFIARSQRVFHAAEDDALATRIHDDLLALCELEKDLPRLQWLQLLMTFLRFALPIWLLASMRPTVLLRDWLVDALTSGRVPDEEALRRAVASRHRSLLHPTTTPTSGVLRHVELFMRARVETTELLTCLEEEALLKLDSREITISSNSSAMIGLEELLVEVAKCREKLSRGSVGRDPRQLLTLKAEGWRAWKNPTARGTQGNNYDEFLRVLRRADTGDVGKGYLLAPISNSRPLRFVVFPGSTLLATIACLANRAKERQPGGAARKGRLLLGDVESHFNDYGVDFYSSAGARPKLISKLQQMGLLRGSPDAGDSAEVTVPYQSRVGRSD